LMAAWGGGLRFIDRLAEVTMEAMAIPGLAIAVTDRERLLRASAYGVADVATGAPVTPDTKFEIGSLGKPFTVTVLMQLHEEGKLALDSPVSEYLPWFRVKTDYGQIKVHHLLNHTSGIVRGTDIAPHGLYESWALRYRKTSAPPGTYFSYSNIGYKTLGFLVEHLTGQSLAEVIRSRVLEPLCMTQTHAAITLETRGTTAIGYTSIYDDRPEHESHPLTPAVWAEYGTGDGAQASTVSDMCIYLRMLLNRGMSGGRPLISRKSFELMTENGIWTGGDFYGSGLASYSVEGTIYIGHGGGNAGFRSALVIDMKAGLGVVLLANRMGETDPIVEVAQQALTAVRSSIENGRIPSLPQPRNPAEVPDAADYGGMYRGADKHLELTSAEGKLLLHHQGRTLALERRKSDSFYVPHPDFALSLLDFGRQSATHPSTTTGPSMRAIR
jgi:CubicO group peptidase (beta-lactamase class C family)